MKNADKQAIAERINAMTDEEKAFIVKFVPSEYLTKELERRHITAVRILNDIDTVLDDMSDNPSLDEMQIAINKIKLSLR